MSNIVYASLIFPAILPVAIIVTVVWIIISFYNDKSCINNIYNNSSSIYFFYYKSRYSNSKVYNNWNSYRNNHSEYMQK